MKAYVYTDASLERYAGRFVWLSINTEEAKNAAFLKRYPIPALPTLLVLDAKRDAVTLRYVGGAAPRSWKTRGRAAESLIFSLAMAGEQERCASRAIALFPRVKGTTSAAIVAPVGLSCAAGLDKNHPKRTSFLQSLEKATRQTFEDRKIVMSDDDRSGLYMSLIEARDAAGDEEQVVKLKHEWAAFLEGAAARAKTPEQRTVYDS